MNSKFIRIFAVLIVIVLMIVSVGPSILATEVAKEEQEIRELAEVLEFMDNEAAIKNENGQTVDIDIKKVRDEFPPSSELNKMLAEIQKKRAQAKKEQAKMKAVGQDKPQGNLDEQSETMVTTFGYRERYNACVADKLGSWAGDFVPIFVISSIYQYLADDEYYKAAKKLVKAGVKGSVWGIAGTLSWITIECTWEEGNY